jgi:anti-sigma factor ChrR (cupin superfamily)
MSQDPDLLSPSPSLWERLTGRIAAEEGRQPLPSSSPPQGSAEPDWEEAAPGVYVKLLATDTRWNRVTLLVRLAPGRDYPAHRHAGLEELHLLDGELMIDDRKLRPGDYSRAEAGSVDRRVWSETGCMCVLITSYDDVIL